MLKDLRATMLVLAIAPALASCNPASDKSGNASTGGQTAAVASPCSGTWPAYWQDPAFDKQGMWEGQTVSDTPASQNWTPQNPAYTNAPFQLADAYSKGKPDDAAAQPWRDAKFDALFKPGTPQPERDKLANEYGWAVMHYIQEGNIDSGNVNTDWNHCTNKVRQWFNMPFQTYDVMQGREFIHGLTREAPVTLSVSTQAANLGTTVWAIGFYNGNAAPTLASVWKDDGTVATPTTNLAFGEGTVVGKLLFTTADSSNMPFLSNLPSWTANLSSGAPGSSNPTYCSPPGGASMPEQSKLCARKPGKVTLMQFDIATRDARAPNGWVFGTFVADGQAKAGEKNPWNRISLLGLIWGNDTPPTGQLAATFPADPKKNGFGEGVIAWDVVDRLNKSGGSTIAMQPGHLGCNSRLNGPADNVSSSCTSCHMTASVPDKSNKTPPIMAQFAGFSGYASVTPQCHIPGNVKDKEVGGITFAQMDSIYFAETKCSSPFQDKINGKCVFVPGVPVYANPASTEWVSTDFSLQLSGALVSWNEWQGDVASDKAGLESMAAPQKARVFSAEIPERGE
jgi:hypothetical protein